MLPEDRDFFIRGEDGQEYGPVGLGELREWVRENRAGLGTQVRLDEPGARWQEWQHYPELVALLAEVRVTAPVPGHPALALAPLGNRALAFTLDFILIGFLIIPIVFVLNIFIVPDWYAQTYVATWHALMGQTDFPAAPPIPLYAELINRLLPDTLLVLYMAIFHMAHGRTPGKSCLQIKVVDEIGQKPSPTKSFYRALILILSMNLCFIPLLYVFFNPQRRAFHDFIAGTYVVRA